MSNIWIAASDGNLELVIKYLESGSFTPNSADPQGYTPMHAAASYDHLELLQYLKQHGGNPNAQDGDGDTPLHHCENVNTARLLVQMGADFTIKNKEGKTAGEYIREEGEFADLGKYLGCVEQSGDDTTAWELFNKVDASVQQTGGISEADVKAFLSAPEEELTPALSFQRKQLEEIMTNESLTEIEKEEKLREYVMGIVSGQMDVLTGDADLDAGNDRDSKRRK